MVTLHILKFNGGFLYSSEILKLTFLHISNKNLFDF